MQPYFMPYIGYFQLINAVDKFVIYDDVTYIKQGWVNRNFILTSAGKFLFTLPIEDQSSYRRIKDTKLKQNNYQFWSKKFLKTLEYEYRNSPHYDSVIEMMTSLLRTEYQSLAELNLAGIKLVCSYIGIRTALVESSSVYANDHMIGCQRVIDICQKESATVYVNSPGGRDLYERKIFQKNGIDLRFLTVVFGDYQQKSDIFVPGLSIIDLMMNCSPDLINEMLSQAGID